MDIPMRVLNCDEEQKHNSFLIVFIISLDPLFSENIFHRSQMFFLLLNLI